MATLTTNLKVISMLSLYASLISANNLLHCDYQLQSESTRVCPEDVVVFVCNVSGGVATVWRGSIFNCPTSGNQILFRHNIFKNEDEVSRICNNGDIIAYSSEVTNNSYSSQLNVIVSPEMHNGTVECIQQDFNEISIGTCTLILATGNKIVAVTACNYCSQRSSEGLHDDYNTFECPYSSVKDYYKHNVSPFGLLQVANRQNARLTRSKEVL
jgi:TctA family transporter